MPLLVVTGLVGPSLVFLVLTMTTVAGTATCGPTQPRRRFGPVRSGHGFPAWVAARTPVPSWFVHAWPGNVAGSPVGAGYVSAEGDWGGRRSRVRRNS